MKIGKFAVRCGRAGGNAAVAAVVGLVLSAGLAAGGLAAAPAALAGPLAVPNPAAAGATSSEAIRLITGDRVAVATTRSGSQADAVTRAAGSAGTSAVIRLSVGGRAYVVPADALPYLNRGLSPSLFEPALLLRAETGGRLPVSVDYQGRLHPLPGITIIRSGGGTARGYLTARSAPVFGSALARQFAADHARASYGADGIFAGGVSIGLPGQVPAPSARPDYAMRTLTLTAADLRGLPDTGDTAMVLNVDSSEKFSDFNEIFNVFYHGTAKFSVPVGHYIAIGIFVSMSGTKITGYRMVTQPQLTVAGDTTAALDERTATDRVQMVTPRPAATQDITLDLHRVMADSQADNTDTFDDNVDAGRLPLWTNQTTRPVTVGSLRTIATGYLTSPPGPGAPYEYDLAFAGPSGLIGPQRYVITPASLGTVHAGFYQAVASTGGWEPQPVFGFQFAHIGRYTILISFIDTFPFRLPRSLTQYFSAGPSLLWSNQYNQSLSNLAGGQADTFRTFVPGQVTSQQWNAYPLHPAPNVSVLGAAAPFAQLPSASRAGNTLTLDITPFSDNTPGHTGTGFSRFGPGGCGCRVTGSYQLDQNGKKIASGNAASGGTVLYLQASLTGKPAVVRLVLTAARTGREFRLSTASQTTWTWRSRRAPGARLPVYFICADLSQSCAVQPLLTLLYQVRGLAIGGSAPSGPQLIRVTAGHLQLARAAKITGLTAQWSVNDGRAWRAATVTPASGGQFMVAFTAPPGAQVTLRLHAADAAGGQITETITRGYQTVP